MSTHSKQLALLELPTPASDNPLHGSSEIEAAFIAWNALASRHHLSIVRAQTRSRKLSLARCLRQFGGLRGWVAVLDEVERSPFLLGNSPSGWRVTFDFLLKPTKFARIMEGSYAASPGRCGATSWVARLNRRRSVSQGYGP